MKKVGTGLWIAILSVMTAGAWLGLELWAYMTGRPLITEKVRDWNKATGGLVALVFGFVTGLLGGHFFW